MGKHQSAMTTKSHRHDPLHKQLAEHVSSHHQKNNRRREKRRSEDLSLNQHKYVDASLSKKILKIAQDQQREIDEMDGICHTNHQSAQLAQASQLSAPVFGSNVQDMDSDMDSDLDENQLDEWNDNDDDILDVDPQDLRILETYFPDQTTTRRSLADIISDKIAAYDNPPSTDEAAVLPDRQQPMNPKLIEAFTKIGKLMSRYKSGKLPKAFKIIPSMSNWEDILYLTRPDMWTPHATFQATKIFVSNLNPKLAQRFLNVFLLEKVRDEIHRDKKLSYHMYFALKKSLYKPAAFFKGILLPLVNDGCSLREAAIVGSVVSKVSVPALHSAACLMKLCDMEYSGAGSLFIRILLDKKYALPYKVIDALIFYFIQFNSVSGTDPANRLPVLWFQALLVFVQRYKQDITLDQRDALLDLIKVHVHYSITPEIRRELMVFDICRKLTPASQTSSPFAA